VSAAWPTAAETTLANLIRDWSGLYHLEFDGSAYRAVRYDGTELTKASTPEGLDSVLRADWYRHWYKRWVR